jgi:hypothetical protein
MGYNFEDYINGLAGNFDKTENFDATSNLLSADEHFEAVNVENYLQQSKRISPHVARKMAERIVKSPASLAMAREEMRKSGMSVGFGGNPAMPHVGNLQAQVNFQIKRLTADINAILPVPLFGPYDLASDYNQILSLPNGVSISAIEVGKIGGGELKVTISYLSGGDTDKVEITLQEYAYPSFLEALKGSKFTISNARYSISDTSNTGVQQLTQSLQANVKSMFGKTTVDNIPLSASKSPFQQQNGIVDIIGTFGIDAQTTWVLGFQPLANQQVTIGAFITGAEKAGVGM